MKSRRGAPVLFEANEGLQDCLESYPLTRREREIVFLLLQGLSNREIAEKCFIVEQTVKDHLKHVFTKLGVHQRAALISWVLKFPPARTSHHSTLNKIRVEK